MHVKNYYTSRYIFLILIFTLTIPLLMTGQKSIPKDFCMSNNELNLFDQINKLRVDYDKKAIQLSSSLSYVANQHVIDIETNHPDTSICNSSSWSDKGNWTPCCYNSYVHNPDCMWDKPKELTPYPYRGYELVLYFEDSFTNDSIINLMSDSKEVLDMILTRGIYEKKNWICGGIAIGNNYVSLWFGQRRDVQKKPVICTDEERVTDTSSTRVHVTEIKSYYLIFGSFPDIHGAREALRKVKEDGFNDSGILENNDKIRIYLNKFGNLKEAMYAKQQLPYSYKEAWILKD